MKMKQKSQSKLVVAMSAVILLLVALSATLTFAYFTAGKESSEATINFGHLTLDGDKITISQTETGVKIVPGDSLKVAGSAKLNNNIDAFYRVKIDVQASTVEGKDNISAEQINTIINSVVTAGGFNAETLGAKQHTDGYYYGFAAKDANTQLLDFTNKTIAFDAATYGNIWQDREVTFAITVQAIQAKNLTGITADATALNDLATLAAAAAWKVNMSTGI